MEPINVTLMGVRGASRTKDPADPNFYEITALVPVMEVVKHISNGPFANLREGCSADPTANKTSPIAKLIKNQLATDPEMFLQKNNGITLIADEAVADAHGQPGTLKIVYSNSAFLREHAQEPNNTQQIRGLGNGGTTAGAIAEAVSEGLYPNANGTAYVRLTVKCGAFDRNTVHDMVEGLNKNKQIDSFSSANYSGAFKEIREFLESDRAEVAGYHFPPVSYFFGDSGSYEIQDLVQFLVLFVRTNAEGDLIPHAAYAGVENCLRYYQTPDGKKACLRLLPLLPKIVYLYEFICANARTAYNKKGSFFSTRLFSGTEIAPEELPFSHLETTVRANNGWTFPLLAAFSSVVSDNGKEWRVNPQDLFLELAPTMIRSLNKSFENLGGSRGGKVSSLGRTEDVYIVQQAIVDRRLAQRR